MGFFSRAQRPAQNEALESAIGPTSTLAGTLRSDGGVRVDGVFAIAHGSPLDEQAARSALLNGLSGRFAGNAVVRFFAQPGLWLQRLTTKEPDRHQLAVACRALESVLPLNEEDEKDVRVM